jgi:hypothetical protein
MDLTPTWMCSAVDPKTVQDTEVEYRILHYYRRKWRPWTYITFVDLNEAHKWIDEQRQADIEYLRDYPDDKYHPHETVRIIKTTVEISEDVTYKLDQHEHKKAI